MDQAWVVLPTTDLTDLGLQAEWHSTAVGINDHGTIVGRIWPDNGTAGFVIQNGVTKFLPFPVGASSGSLNAIGPTGQIIGMTSAPDGNALTRYVKRRPTVSTVLIGNVNSGACPDGEGVAINAAGQVAATVMWEAARIEADNRQHLHLDRRWSCQPCRCHQPPWRRGRHRLQQIRRSCTPTAS